jgi:hypothetical protein
VKICWVNCTDYLDAGHGDVAVDAAEDLEEGPAGAALLDLDLVELEKLV